MQSDQGQGAAFRIYLPPTEPTTEPVTSISSEPVRTTGTETILVVEDDATIRDLVQSVLRSSGYTVIAAQNFEEALSASNAYPGKIHLLLVDVVMPGKGGHALATELSRGRPETKVLYMSGYTEDAIVNHGVLEPGILLLQKPFTPEALTRKVRQVLESSGLTANQD